MKHRTESNMRRANVACVYAQEMHAYCCKVQWVGFACSGHVMCAAGMRERGASAQAAYLRGGGWV